MKNIKTLRNQKWLLFSAMFFVTTFAYSQSWDGGGDATSWDDPLNWSSDVLPGIDSLVEFTQDAIVTGTAIVGPARITVKAGADVTLDLDLNIGNGIIEEHSLVINSNSALTLGVSTPRTFFLNPGGVKQGMAMFASSDSSSLVIANETTLEILRGNTGLNLASTTSTVLNNGAILIADDVKNGIKSSGTFINNGAVSMIALPTDGIILGGGLFENGLDGQILITKTGDDCIELIGDSEFVNLGTIGLTAQDSAGSGNNALAIGSATDLANFINTTSGIINASGGASIGGRAISVLEMGSFQNMGQVVLTGVPQSGARMYNRGETINGLNGVIDLTDGRYNINSGSFTNNGFIKSTYDGAGILNSGIATNNAFFAYANSGSFAGGANGTVEDNGINLNSENSRTINGGGTCDLDIAEATYEYFEDVNSIGTTDATGALTLGMEALTADSVIVTTSIDGVELIIKNVCTEAVMTSAIFDTNQEIKELSVYPTLITEGQDLTIDLGEITTENTAVFVYNATGQLKQTIQTTALEKLILSIEDLNNGLHFIRIENEGKYYVGRFMKIQ